MKMSCRAALMLGALLAFPAWANGPALADATMSVHRGIEPRQFELLRSQAQAFAGAMRSHGYSLTSAEWSATSFVLYCRGVAVLDVQNAPSQLVIRIPRDVQLRAPAIVQLYADVQRWLDPGHSPGDLPAAASEGVIRRVDSSERCG